MEPDPSVRTVDQTIDTTPEDTETGWVSPDVKAAEAGERVEMGKDIVDVLPERLEVKLESPALPSEPIVVQEGANIQ